MSKLKSIRNHANPCQVWTDMPEFDIFDGSYGTASMINVEASHTIIQRSQEAPQLLTVDSLTREGWVRTLGLQFGEEKQRDQALNNLIKNLKSYIGDPKTISQRRSRATKIVSFAASSNEAVRKRHSQVEDTNVADDSRPRGVQWGDSPESLLECLENPSTNSLDRDRAVLFTGPMLFNEGQRPRLLAVLAKYIEAHRFTRDDERIIIVGSAARKYAMHMADADFETFAQWLQPKQTNHLSELVELEFVKGVCWRLTLAPVECPVRAPLMIRTLREIVRQYTNSRVLLQKNFDVIALNAIVAVFVLAAANGKSDLAIEIWSYVQDADVVWFAELVFDRIAETAQLIKEHDANLGAAMRSLFENHCTLRTNA